jgi:hypothetical protein
MDDVLESAYQLVRRDTPQPPKARFMFVGLGVRLAISRSRQLADLAPARYAFGTDELTRLMGLDIIVDPQLPPQEYVFRDSDLNVLHRGILCDDE